MDNEKQKHIPIVAESANSPAKEETNVPLSEKPKKRPTRFRVFCKKCKSSIKHQWPAWRIVKWVSNGITLFVGSIWLSVIAALAIGGITAYISLHAVALSLALPEEMTPFSMKTAVTLWKDSFAHDFEKYHQATYDRAVESNKNLDNYNVRIMLQPYSGEEYEASAPKRFSFNTRYNVCGNVKEGVFTYTSSETYDTQLAIHFYQVEENGIYTTYLRFNNQWYKVDSDNPGYFLRVGPQYIVECLEGAKFKETPSATLLSADKSVADEPPFGFIAPVYGEGASGYDSLLFLDDEGRVDMFSCGGLLMPFYYDKLVEYADSIGDHAAKIFLDTYTIQRMTLLTKIEHYGAVDEIILPEEILNAVPFTDEVRRELGDSFLASCASDWERTFTAATKYEDDGFLSNEVYSAMEESRGTPYFVEHYNALVDSEHSFKSVHERWEYAHDKKK